MLLKFIRGFEPVLLDKRKKKWLASAVCLNDLKKLRFKGKKHVPSTFIRYYHNLTTRERKLARIHGNSSRIRCF